MESKLCSDRRQIEKKLKLSKTEREIASKFKVQFCIEKVKEFRKIRFLASRGFVNHVKKVRLVEEIQRQKKLSKLLIGPLLVGL